MADNLDDPFDDPFDGYKRKVKKALNSQGSPQRGCDVWKGRTCYPHWSPPAAIFNPVLAALQQSLNDLKRIDVSEREVSLAAIYIIRAVHFHDLEEARQDAIDGLVNETIGGTGFWGKFPVFLLELKESLVSRDLDQSFREYCNFPCVLIGATANRLEIFVAVSVGPIYVTKLLTLDLSLGFHASDNVVRLARVFKTLSYHRGELEKYYESVKSSPSPTLSCLFPNPTPVDPSKPLPKLTYRQFLSRAGQPTPDILDLSNATSAMYIATLNDTNEEVIVKFTALYNEEARRLLAQAQLAPQLHFCGRVVGDLYMIVMERVDGTSVWQLHKDNIPIPQIVPTKVEEAVRLLHEQDIVFGDLRSNNILYVA